MGKEILRDKVIVLREKESTRDDGGEKK